MQCLVTVLFRTPQNAKVLQMITRCIKALMTHEVSNYQIFAIHDFM